MNKRKKRTTWDIKKFKPKSWTINSISNRKIEIKFNNEGKKILKENSEAFRLLFSVMKNKSSQEIVKKLQQEGEINLGPMKISLIDIANQSQQGYRGSYATLRLSLYNGKEFAFKLGKIRKGNPTSDMNELESSYLIKKFGGKSVDHFLMFKKRGTDNYFVLSKYMTLPTAFQYSESLHGNQRKRFIKKFYNYRDALKNRLSRNGLLISDLDYHNAFVRKKGNRYDCVDFLFFDNRFHRGPFSRHEEHL